MPLYYAESEPETNEEIETIQITEEEFHSVIALKQNCDELSADNAKLRREIIKKQLLASQLEDEVSKVKEKQQQDVVDLIVERKNLETNIRQFSTEIERLKSVRVELQAKFDQKCEECMTLREEVNSLKDQNKQLLQVNEEQSSRLGKKVNTRKQIVNTILQTRAEKVTEELENERLVNQHLREELKRTQDDLDDLVQIQGVQCETLKSANPGILANQIDPQELQVSELQDEIAILHDQLSDQQRGSQKALAALYAKCWAVSFALLLFCVVLWL